MKAKIFGINRHRLSVDGPGITTLVGMLGCPLNCKYCINKTVYTDQVREYTVEELFDELSIDDIYFEYTGGGICFGGHEPLLQLKFITEFIEYAKEQGVDWKFGLETSLNVKLDNIDILQKFDFIIADVKTFNSEVYKEYTGRDNSLVLSNLEHLRNYEGDLKIRVPHIPDYTKSSDIVEALKILCDRFNIKQKDINIFEYSKN